MTTAEGGGGTARLVTDITLLWNNVVLLCPEQPFVDSELFWEFNRLDAWAVLASLSIDKGKLCGL